MGIEGLLNGEELIDKQNDTLKELPSKGLKDFCPNNSWIEKKQIEKKLEEKFNFINAARIEKSNNISLAEWVPQLGKAKVIKKIGKLWETIGHHQANEDWLLPEEILFLVENSELQLFMDNVHASVEDCYALLLEEKCCTLDEYRVYSYLCRAGLRVVRHSPSVTVTPYERQVNLDTIFQRHKRSPPRTSEAKLNDNYENFITIIDEDIDNSVPNKSDTVEFNRNLNADAIEVIEIEDDSDPMPIIEEVLDSSDDSSDIVCISSPSYVCTNKCRQWYPSVQKSLLKPMEKIIDLCDDDPPNNFKELIHNRLDLIKTSKAEVLALLPSAKNGVSVIHSPDKRLLPNNIVPKYSEYKVNLNFKSDCNASFKFNPNRSLMPRMPFTNMMNNSQMNPGFIHNPLIRKSEEIKAMAMNMIQTATTLMSVLTSQNPNELWNFVQGGNQDITRFHYPRFNFLQYRPYNRFPRRNYRPMRRRYPYEKRCGGRYFKRPNESNRYSNDISDPTPIIHHSSEVKMEIVVLSDDEDTINRNDFLTGDLNCEKRKRECSDKNFNKKLKTENDPLDSSVVLEESSVNLENKPTLDIKTTESDNTKTSGINEHEKNTMKKESNSSFHEIKFGVPEKRRQAEIDSEDNSADFISQIITTNINSEIKPHSNKNRQHESITSHEQYKNLENNRNITDQENGNNVISCKSVLQKENMLNFVDIQGFNVEKDVDKESAHADSSIQKENTLDFVDNQGSYVEKCVDKESDHADSSIQKENTLDFDDNQSCNVEKVVDKESDPADSSIQKENMLSFVDNKGCNVEKGVDKESDPADSSIQKENMLIFVDNIGCNVEKGVDKESDPADSSMQIESMLDLVDNQGCIVEKCVAKESDHADSSLQKENMLNFVDNQGCNIEKGVDKESDHAKSFMMDGDSKVNKLQFHSFISTESCTEIKPWADNVFKGKITCWEEFKNRADSQLDVEEIFIDDTEPLIKVEESITYGDILTELQIFKEADMTQKKKKINIAYDVYLPDASFKKSLKVLPNFRVIVTNEEMPTPMDLKCLKTEYQDQIPFLFSVVFNETIGFYLYETISLPSLFE